ncbi:MAG: transposase [Desulfobulbaceae bacterium]
MPRQARLLLANCPHHIIQRGHNRQVIFAGDDDYLYYLDALKDWKARLGCKLYSYCLMTNHVHLVLDPGDQPENISLLMKRLAGRQARHVNRLEGRTGALWEGRYKSSPIQADRYLLACCRYVELNPLRAGMTDDPASYRWSSCPAKTGRVQGNWLDFDPFYLGLAATPEERALRYREWLQQTVPEGEWKLIREATQRGQLAGNGKFVDEISTKLGRRLDPRGPGRPRMEEKKAAKKICPHFAPGRQSSWASK